MKFKVGDLIVHKPMQGTGLHVEAIIVKHWKTEVPGIGVQRQTQRVDNVHLFITFDEDDPDAVGGIDEMRGFQGCHWVVISEI